MPSPKKKLTAQDHIVKLFLPAKQAWNYIEKLFKGGKAKKKKKGSFWPEPLKTLISTGQFEQAATLISGKSLPAGVSGEKAMSLKADLDRLVALRSRILSNAGFARLVTEEGTASDVVKFYDQLKANTGITVSIKTVHAWLSDNADAAISHEIAQWRHLTRMVGDGLSLSGRFEPLINVFDLREFVEGKSVALVANSGALVGCGRGAEIDAHDLVLRFNSFKIEPADTGVKTDIHAAIHLHNFNLDKPVQVRLLFSGNRAAWEKSIIAKIRRGGQQRLGDRSLQWPAKSPALVNDQKVPVPSSGFNMLSLLKLFGTAREVNLFGFDSYEHGIMRVDDAKSLPVSSAHDYDYEKNWIKKNTRIVDNLKKQLIQ